jgi:phosphopantetheinyl transferase (holo-ACP synthase)
MFPKFFSEHSLKVVQYNEIKYYQKMVKTTQRDIRTMKRNVSKLRKESVQTSRNAAVFIKKVFSARTAYIKKHHCVQMENKILLKSLKNFNKICNQQKMMLAKQNRDIDKLQRSANELKRLKNALQSIHVRKRRNPALYREADI